MPLSNCIRLPGITYISVITNQIDKQLYKPFIRLNKYMPAFMCFIVLAMNINTNKRNHAEYLHGSTLFQP